MSSPFKAVRYDVVSGGASDPTITSGTVDPTTGVDKPEGSLYLRFVAGSGEVWFKTAGATTAWTEVGSGGGGGGTLDASYDFGGAGVGRSIAADAGAVEITSAVNTALSLVISGSQKGLNIVVGVGGANTGIAVSLADTTNTSGALAVTETQAQTVAAISVARTVNGSTGPNLSLTRAFGTATAGNSLDIALGANATGRGIQFTSPSSPNADITLSLRAGDPAAPTEADFWYNTSGKVLKYYDGTDIQTLGLETGSSYERHASFGVAIADSTQEATLGRITFSGSIIGLSVHMEDARTAGTVVVNVKKNGATTLTATIDGGSTEFVLATAPVATHGVAGNDEITIEVIADASYDNAAAATTGLVANVTFTESSAAGAEPDVALLNVSQVFTAGQAVAQSTLSDGAAIAIDGDASNNFDLELTQNSDLANPTNVVAGMTINVAVRQDATGNFTLGFGSAYLFPGGAPTVTAGASKEDLISCYVRTESSGTATVMLCSIAQDHVV